MKKASTSFSYQFAFVLSKEVLAKLEALLAQNIGEIDIKCSCSDGIDRQFAGTEDLFTYENPKAKEISDLTLSARASNYQATSSIRFEKDGLNSIRVFLDGDGEMVERLRQDIVDVIEGTKAWYSSIARIQFAFTLIALFFLLAFLGPDLAWYLRLISETEEITTHEGRGNIIVFIAFIVLLTIGGRLDDFRAKTFPIATYQVGQGLQRHGVLEKARWGVGVALLVSLVAGLLLR